MNEGVGARGRRAAVPRVIGSLGRGIGAGDGGRGGGHTYLGRGRARFNYEASSTLGWQGRAELVAAVILGMVHVRQEAHGPHLKSLWEF